MRRGTSSAQLTAPYVRGRRRDRSSRLSILRRFLWATVPLWSLGMLAWIPFFRRALSVQRRRAWWVTAVYLILAVAEITFASLGGDGPNPTPAQNAFSSACGFLALFLMGGGAIHTWVAFRPALAYSAVPALPASPEPEDKPLETAMLARQHRIDAQRIVEVDPALARDLRIGRPDLARVYDDGGLVDVNHVSADLLVSVLNWTPDEAADVVVTRESLGGFSSAAELIAYTALDPGRVDGVADLIVFCRV